MAIGKERQGLGVLTTWLQELQRQRRVPEGVEFPIHIIHFTCLLEIDDSEEVGHN